MENQIQAQDEKTTFNKDEVTGFLKNNLPQIVKTYFKEPMTGTHNLFVEATNKAYFNAVVLIVATGLLYVIVPYLLLGDMRDYVGFGPMFKVGMSISLLLVTISLISFAVKSIAGKPDFKKELLTGGLCGIALTVLLAIMVLAKVLLSNMDITDMMSFSGLENLRLLALPALFVPLLLINTILQSFKASKVNETLAWYTAPLVLGVAIYITKEIIVKSIF